MSIVFPCLNEAESITACINEAYAQIAASRLTGEALVCDNGSVDRSVDLAQLAGARIVSESRKGYGAAIAAGVSAARGEYVVMVDCDGSYDLSAVPAMVAALDSGADLVVGNRFRGQMAEGAMPWLHQHVGNPLLSALLNIFFGTHFGDAHCGMRAFTRAAYGRMALQAVGMEFASEMLARAARIGLNVSEVPVNYQPRGGRSKLRRYRDGWRHVRFLLMYSPTWLYILPSAAFGVLGFVLLLALAASPVVFLGRQWDMHLSALASLTTVVATQVAWLGISARTIAVIHGLDPVDPFLQRFYDHFNLELGLVVAMLLVAGGGGIGGVVLMRWIGEGLPPLDAIRPLLLAVTLVMVGVQSGFNAFFLSLLSVQTNAAPPR